MQLSGAPGRLEAALRRHSGTLLALCLCVAPALAGVLPEDRTDLLYHRYEGGGITVQGPSLLIQKKLTDNLALTANYYEDMISSASIDVKLAASPYKETRKQKSAGFEYLHGKSTYSAGLINSVEPDYRSNTSYYSISQDMFGDLTTFTLTYKRGWDKVFKDGKVAGRIENVPFPDEAGVPDPGALSQDADHRGYTVGLSQILTRNLIATLNYEVLTDQGYLQSPYREILFLDPTQALGYSKADQIYPNTRTSNAAAFEAKYYLPYRAALTGQYRYFQDTWGIRAHTFEVGYTQPVWRRLILDGSVRFYTQNAASFYSDLFPRAAFQNFEARDRELAAFNSYSLGLGASWDFPKPPVPWINHSSLSMRIDHLLIDYKDYRNALLIDPAAGIRPGDEPLYKLNANIFQLFMSVWF
ncbi:MAG TPA: DUF3570 domain-containing protein [Steroidobacteraceae bacterium]|nr:DUF3570 domain-containing protein [Steroidobacteraceae bacterium]